MEIKTYPPTPGKPYWKFKYKSKYIVSTRKKEKYEEILKKCQEAETEEDLLKIREEYGKTHKKHYIYKYGKKWRIIKNQKYYGSFETLKGAEEYRDFLEENDWNPTLIRYSRKRWKWTERSRINKHIYLTPYDKYVIIKNNEYYGTYDTFEEAERERDLLQKYNWDITEMVEGEGTIYL